MSAIATAAASPAAAAPSRQSSQSSLRSLRARDRIAYTIVSGDQLQWPPDWKQTRRDGVELRSTERDGTTTVTWLREGRTCVLSGAAAPREELLALAAWKGEGTVSF